MRIKMIVTAWLVCVLSRGAEAVPDNLFSIVTIGDSLSDTGNLSTAVGLPPSGLYYGDAGAATGTGAFAADMNRRYSNGPVWIERLENLLGGTPEFDTWFRAQWLQGTGSTIDATFGLPEGSFGPVPSSGPINGWGANGASGGAQTNGTLFGGSSLAAQGQFFSDFLDHGLLGVFQPYTPDERERSLFVVQGGGNDFFNILTPADVPAVLGGAVDTLGTIISNLAAAGASHFLVPNLPGYIVADDWVTATPADVRALSQAFNGLLAIKLDDLRTNLGVEIVEVDWFSLFDAIAADPGAWGLTNTSQPCLNFNAALGLESACGNPDTYLMYDALHPTAVVHQAMAQAAYNAVQASTVPLPAGWILMASGALAFLRSARRRGESRGWSDRIQAHRTG